ncbi:hypothetical protein [Natrinema salsiterrestre]|uniref:Uncharacterized protein n=1 Tax=Natrinema salsiterrestre TaxID=2950540 RepID=A0A9Q4LA79_9EURY|nr:hypothetical protein [Natrinema salsiterrestre]MDF9748211.1 hypothetical protein [Natrinema salsiterrestre]
MVAGNELRSLSITHLGVGTSNVTLDGHLMVGFHVLTGMGEVKTEAPFIERATAVQWDDTGDALGILYYVLGDAENSSREQRRSDGTWRRKYERSRSMEKRTRLS